jgi:hypothetical protein
VWYAACAPHPIRIHSTGSRHHINIAASAATRHERGEFPAGRFPHGEQPMPAQMSSGAGSRKNWKNWPSFACT